MNATATNIPHISPRARKALDILADGGQFVQRLERDAYTGREKFAFRLTMTGQIVKGFGLAVFYELKNANFLKMADSTSVSTYYSLDREAA